MAKILELQRKDKHNKERTVGSIEIKNQTETTADLCFFGDINSESLGEWQKYYPEDKAPKDVQDFLDQLEDVSKINVHINSGGGSVFGGIAIYNILKRYDAEITVYVEGLAASIASVIAMAAATQRTAKAVNSTTYTVKKGDCLSMIAKNLTGSSANWRAIYNQNKGVIGGNPNLIYPGQNLVINV